MSLEQLRDNYYDAISLLNNKDDIVSALPNTTYPNGYRILWGVIDRIKKDMESYEEIASELENDEERAQLAEILDICQFKIDICTEIILQDDEEIENSDCKDKHLIFGTISNGNPFFERDIKEFSEEAYQDILNCINNIKNGAEENVEKGRTFNKNNGELAGTKESKSFQTRVLYKNVASDCVFIYLMYEKKDDKTTYLSNLMKVRKNYFIKEIAELKEKLKDPAKRDKIIAENEVIEENLRVLLNTQKRSKKGNK